MMKKIFNEPLIHFLFLGFLLYVYYAQVSPQVVSNQTTIKVSPYEINEFQSEYKELDAKHLDILVQKLFYDKVLLNEAYALKLDKQDEKIQTILLKKIKQIIGATKLLKEPTQKQLKEYYDNHKDDYIKALKLSFTQIVVADEEEAQKYLEMFRVLDIDAQDGVFFSQHLALKYQYKNLSYNDIKKIFGNYFALKLFRLKKETWYGIINSKYAKHLVFISSKIGKNIDDFNSVEDRVYEDYMLSMREKIYKDAFKNILKQYRLEIQK